MTILLKRAKDRWVFEMSFREKINYPQWAMINFAVLTIFGIVLRCMQLLDVRFLNYQFLLHSHSHFAFSGWMFFVIALLITHFGGGDQNKPGFKYIFIFALISAYGMLVSFSLQGYKAISITFSTVFIFVTYWFAYLVLKSGPVKNNVNETAYKLISAALIFVCISSLGPFLLGPLVALGYKTSSLYQDAIYFYLHFQMNGFMFLASLGLVAATLLNVIPSKHQRVWLDLFVYSTIPLYFIFTLWDKPDDPIRTLACLGAGLNLVSWLMLCWNFRKAWDQFSFLIKTALIAASLKIIFQVLVCIPYIGEWAFLNRNLIVGYIHLLTLGTVMPIIIDQFIQKGFLKSGKTMSVATWCYVVVTVIYLSLLFIQPLLSSFLVTIPGYQFLLFILCLLFLPIALTLLANIKRRSILKGHQQK
jgi:hypothetical protein